MIVVANTEILGFATISLYRKESENTHPPKVDYWCEAVADSGETLASDYAGQTLAGALDCFNAQCKLISDLCVVESFAEQAA